jgi:hypothetical protein
MQLRITLTFLVVGFLLVPAAALAGSSSSRAWGSGTGPLFVVAGDTTFDFNVREGANGPVGWVSASGDPDDSGPLEPFTAAGPITCLRVEGRRASFKWRFARATGSAEPLLGGGVQSFVEDNGRPRDGDPVDRVTIDALQPQPVFDLTAQQCLHPDLMLARYQDLEAGDVTVRDR